MSSQDLLINVVTNEIERAKYAFQVADEEYDKLLVTDLDTLNQDEKEQLAKDIIALVEEKNKYRATIQAGENFLSTLNRQTNSKEEMISTVLDSETVNKMMSM